MSTTIQYNSNYADYSISSYLREWANNFGDIDQAPAETKIVGVSLVPQPYLAVLNMRLVARIVIQRE